MDFKIESFNLRQMCKCANARAANKPTNPTNLNSESSQSIKASEKGSNPSRLQNCWDKRSNGLASAVWFLSLGLEKCIFHAMDSQTNWKIWAVVETKLPETLSLFFFPSFHNLYFRTQHHLIKIYLNEMLIKTFPAFLKKWKLLLWSILIQAGSLVICCDTNQRSFLFWVAIKRSTYWKLIHNKIFTLTA